MPIYEYRCDDCSHEFESIQKISDDPLLECPDCHEESLTKLVSASSFRLKGGGWYETDFKTGAKKHGTQDKSEEKSSSGSGASENKGGSEGKKSASGSSKSGSSDSSSSGSGSSSKSATSANKSAQTKSTTSGKKS